MKKIAYLLLPLFLLGAGCGLQQAPTTTTPNETTQNGQSNQSGSSMPDQSSDTGTQMNNQESQTSGSMTDEAALKGRQMLTQVTVNPDDLADNEIVVLLVSHNNPESKQSAAPAEKFGCDDYLYPLTVKLSTAKTQSDLATALVQLLVQRKDAFADKGLENDVWNHGLTLSNIHYDNGKRVIDFSGQPEFTDACEAQRVETQVEETVKLYEQNFVIQLNGSADDWGAAFQVAS